MKLLKIKVFMCGVFLFSLISCGTFQKLTLYKRYTNLKDETSEGVIYVAPPLPFKKQASQSLDALWLNESNNNSISYFSSCPKDIALVTLEEIEKGVLSETKNHIIIKTEKKGEGRYTLFHLVKETSGKNSTPQNLNIASIYSVKTKKCFYVLNFFAKTKADFKRDKIHFDRFVNSFKEK